MRFELLMARK